jgi:hypothetical protein
MTDTYGIMRPEEVKERLLTSKEWALDTYIHNILAARFTELRKTIEKSLHGEHPKTWDISLTLSVEEFVEAKKQLGKWGWTEMMYSQFTPLEENPGKKYGITLHLEGL